MLRDILQAFLVVPAILAVAEANEQNLDLSKIPIELTPVVTNEKAAPGKRVRQFSKQYPQGKVYHTLYLPTDWQPGKKYPVIVEYAGNKYKTSLGTVEGCLLGYGLTGGKEAIWVCLPFIDTKQQSNATQWWGDVTATVSYCKQTVKQVCQQYGGDPKKVFLAGFSRGAIACNFIGLHDDEIARLWCGFICHSHYDGVRKWNYKGSDRASAAERLKRLGNRPQFISHEKSVTQTKEYLKTAFPNGNFTYLSLPFADHTATWILRDIPERKRLRDWYQQVLSDLADADSKPITFLKTWGEQGQNPGQFHFPIAIAINTKDEVYITDHLNHRLQKFDLEGQLLADYSVLPNPAAIAITKDGKICLTHFYASGKSTETSGNFVSIYSPQGKLLKRWGKTGSAAGQFNCPGGIAIAANGHIYIADQTNHRIQVFNASGQFIKQWGTYGNQPGQFGGKSSKNSRTGGPQFIAFDASGNIWTTEGANCRIQKFSPTGKPLKAWGTNNDKPGGFGGLFTGFKNRKPGRLLGPIALCFDKQQRLWISAVSGRVQQFTQQGRYLRGLVADQGTQTGQFYAPHGVAFDSRGHLYIVDAFNHRIQKFKVN